MPISLYFLYFREIEERKKEVDKFYKSDDDSDDEEVEKMDNESLERKDSSEVNNDENLPKMEGLFEIKSVDEDKVLSNEFGLPDLNPIENKENDFDKEKLEEMKIGCDNENSNAAEIFGSSTHSELRSHTINIEQDMEKSTDRDMEETKAEKDTEVTTLKTADVVEEKNSNVYDSEDDLRLHLDTEDFDNDSNSCPESEMKNCSKEAKDSSCAELKEKSEMNSTPKFNLLASKFPQLNLNNLKNFTPKLSEGKDSYIDLEEEEEEDLVQKRGIDTLLNRFIEHTKKKKTNNNAKKVSLGLVFLT